MTDSGYLVLNRRGIVRMTKRMPALRSGEILVRLNVSFEPTLFDPPVVNLSITRNHVMDSMLDTGNRVPRVGLQYVPSLDDGDWELRGDPAQVQRLQDLLTEADEQPSLEQINRNMLNR